jgi:hypothetical protein
LILALRPSTRQTGNWEVAKFSLGPSPVTDVDARINQIARILARAALGHRRRLADGAALH